MDSEPAENSEASRVPTQNMDGHHGSGKVSGSCCVLFLIVLLYMKDCGLSSCGEDALSEKMKR